MIQVRNRLFETNSSSTHSLVINPTPNYEDTHKLVLNDNGEVEVNGWDQTSEFCAYGFYEKLAYMLTWMYLRENDNPYWSDAQEFEDFVYPSDYVDTRYDDEYQTILEVIQKHFPKVTGFRLTNIGDINWDHQTMPYESDFVIDLYDDTQIEGYLFNDDAVVKVGRD